MNPFSLTGGGGFSSSSSAKSGIGPSSYTSGGVNIGGLSKGSASVAIYVAAGIAAAALIGLAYYAGRSKRGRRKS